MGVTRELAPVLIRQFLHSYWSRATTGTACHHHAIRGLVLDNLLRLRLGKIIKNQASLGTNHQLKTSSPHIDYLNNMHTKLHESPGSLQLETYVYIYCIMYYPFFLLNIHPAQCLLNHHECLVCVNLKTHCTQYGY